MTKNQPKSNRPRGLSATQEDGVEVVAKLRELSEVLGVEVVGIEDMLSRRTSRKLDLARWHFDVPGVGPHVPVFDSRWFRSAEALNAWAQWCGRDREARALTSDDRRRALRLMHEAVEEAQLIRQKRARVAIDNLAAMPELIEACGMLELVVEDALSPVLAGGRMRACQHVAHGVPQGRRLTEPVEVDRVGYLCPMHPGELFCDHEGCTEQHYREHHSDEELSDLRCFVCSTPVANEVASRSSQRSSCTVASRSHSSTRRRTSCT